MSATKFVAIIFFDVLLHAIQQKKYCSPEWAILLFYLLLENLMIKLYDRHPDTPCKPQSSGAVCQIGYRLFNIAGESASTMVFMTATFMARLEIASAYT